MSLTTFLTQPQCAERYRKVRRYFHLRESAYDVTSICQLRCEGCYYFQGDKYRVKDNRTYEDWVRLMEGEKARGITFVNLAGAEPSLVPEVLRACYGVIPTGCVFTNGLKRIDPDVRYRIHISVWGGAAGDPVYRRYSNGRVGPFCLPLQLANYKDDDRPVFVYTFNGSNVDQVDEVLRAVNGEGHKLTFNIFSRPRNVSSNLEVQDTFSKTRDKMAEAMRRYPETVLYSYYNAEVHTADRGLHAQFGCTYPRAAGTGDAAGWGIGHTFRTYRADLTPAPQQENCCVPDTDCADCRHYASGSAIVTSRLEQHVDSDEHFAAWLDYVDTYLAVWVLGYAKGPNLYRPQWVADPPVDDRSRLPS